MIAAVYKKLVDGVKSVKESMFNYVELPYVVVAVRGNTLYGIDSTKKKLYKSTNNGDTWSSVLWTIPSGTIQIAHLTAYGVIIITSTDGKVYRSTDDATFTAVLSGINSPLNSAGIGSNGHVVCFGEYVLTDGVPVRIYQSQDDGATWNIGLNVGNSNSAGVRHFHSCQYLSYQAVWIATTGDETLNWYRSFDGVTWTLLFSSTDQRRRTLGIVCRKKDELIYCSDGGGGYGGIFKSLWNAATNEVDDTDIARVLTTTSSYGMDGAQDVLMATTVTTPVSPNKVAYIYISLDGGNNWVLDGAFNIKPSETYGGFLNVVGHDDKGNFYLQLSFPEGRTEAAIGIKAVANISNTKHNIHEQGIYVAGTKKLVVQRALTVANAVKGVTNYLAFKPGIGAIETLLLIGCNIPAVTGATSGTHQLSLTWGASGWPGRVFTISAPYNVALMLTPFGIGTGVTFVDGSFDIIRRMLDGKTIQLSKDTTIAVVYENKTDADRTDTITVNLATLKEYVTPLI